jgi:competence protein ComFC
MLESVASFLYSETHPQRCIGCDRRASALLCRACFEALPQIGRPVYAWCGMPTAFETFIFDECKGVVFSFESARVPLRYTGVGMHMVHSLKYQDYAIGSSIDWQCR